MTSDQDAVCFIPARMPSRSGYPALSRHLECVIGLHVDRKSDIHRLDEVSPGRVNSGRPHLLAGEHLCGGPIRGVPCAEPAQRMHQLSAAPEADGRRSAGVACPGTFASRRLTASQGMTVYWGLIACRGLTGGGTAGRGPVRRLWRSVPGWPADHSPRDGAPAAGVGDDAAVYKRPDAGQVSGREDAVLRVIR